jgi:hypothetical protein
MRRWMGREVVDTSFSDVRLLTTTLLHHPRAITRIAVLDLPYLVFSPSCQMEGRDYLRISNLSLHRMLAAALTMTQIQHQQARDLSPSRTRTEVGLDVMRKMGVPRVSRGHTRCSSVECSLARGGKLVGRMMRRRQALNSMKEAMRSVRVGAVVGLVAA